MRHNKFYPLPDRVGSTQPLPLRIDRYGTVALSAWEPTHDGSSVAYSLADGGSDWRTIQVRDIAPPTRWLTNVMTKKSRIFHQRRRTTAATW
ncbi:MAG TPA: hypothetical protein DDZ51_09365 [Planctomycetaceae bacterium]|nr:hypothetical protein [Planctomycetaceae bacterium]